MLVAGGLTFQTISTGDLYTCGLTPSGAAYCWGDNSFGQVGDGTRVLGPVPVVGGLTFGAPPVVSGAPYPSPGGRER
ncbi:MAG: hypothetical protein KatS3mg081_2590 [Gemmatimonadales bacterium]|nr:MAG: hypothetical protein KatS3mg081_2590 [Gemmatimonadales bacterium]